MSASLLRLTDARTPDGKRGAGPIGLFYLVKNNLADLKVYLRVSGDEAATWGESTCVTERDGYHVMNNDRVARLSGGRLLCLEFSKPMALIRPFYRLFSATVIPRLGAWVSRNPDAYHYLVESIQRFPDQEEFRGIMQKAGFESVTYRNFSLGIACLHIGRKPYAAAG